MILFLKFKQQGQILFLDQERHIDVDPKEKYFILLSPSLYWIKKVTLPLKYTHEVKKIAATLFEEILPEGNYNYYVVKQNDSFLIFAYQDSKILSLLSQKGIGLGQVRGISFAQFACENLDESIQINEKYVLSKEDGIALLLPSVWFQNSKSFDEVELQAPKQQIHLEQFSHIVDSKTLYKVVVLLLLFIALFTAEYIYFLQQKEQIQQKREALFSEYKLKPTLMQNRAILAKYKKEDTKARKLRTYINYFLKANYSKGERILSLEYNGSVLEVVFKNVKEEDLKRLLSRFYKAKIAIKTKTKADKLIVEVKI